MPLPVCAALVGYLCVTGASPSLTHTSTGLYSYDSVKTRSFEALIMFSDLYEIYTPSEMGKVCEEGSCFVYKVSYQNCEIGLVLFRYKDETEIGPTNVSYSLDAKNARGLRRAVSDIYVNADTETKHPLFSLARIINADAVAATCKRK